MREGLHNHLCYGASVGGWALIEVARARDWRRDRPQDIFVWEASNQRRRRGFGALLLGSVVIRGLLLGEA